jgi:hypothetical protein
MWAGVHSILEMTWGLVSTLSGGDRHVGWSPVNLIGTCGLESSPSGGDMWAGDQSQMTFQDILVGVYSQSIPQPRYVSEHRYRTCHSDIQDRCHRQHSRYFIE